MNIRWHFIYGLTGQECVIGQITDYMVDVQTIFSLRMQPLLMITLSKLKLKERIQWEVAEVY